MEVTAGLAESNGSLLPGLWRDSLHVTCGLTACTPGSAPGPTLGNEYGKTVPLPLFLLSLLRDVALEMLSQQDIGSFLVRDSTTHPGCYALSVKVPKYDNPLGISHYLITRTSQNTVRFKVGHYLSVID